MRLSEAIREGGAGRVQIQDRAWEPLTGGVCAMGAAYFAVGEGGSFGTTHVPTAKSLFPEAAGIALSVECPIGCAYPHQLPHIFSAVAHLNDEHGWTFEQIADWVQAQEAIHSIGVEAEKPELVEAR